jgi:phage tail-like protein
MLGSINSNFEKNPLDVNYTLDVNDTRLASFRSLSGGDIEINVIKHNVVLGSGEYQTFMIPGPTNYAPIVLEKGYGNTKELYNWFVKANGGKAFSARTNATIMLYAFMEGEYTPLVGWNLINAWPSKISGFQSDQSNPSSLATFSMTLVVEGIERFDP